MYHAYGTEGKIWLKEKKKYIKHHKVIIVFIDLQVYLLGLKCQPKGRDSQNDEEVHNLMKDRCRQQEEIHSLMKDMCRQHEQVHIS